MNTFGYSICLALLAASLSGCAQTSTASDLDPSVTTAEFTLKDGGRLLGNDPAANAFGKVKGAFSGKNKHPSLAVYELKTPEPASATRQAARFAEIAGTKGLSAKTEAHPTPGRHGVITKDGDRELSYNDENDSELYVDRAKFHQGEGVAPAALAGDSDFIETARKHVANKLAAKTNGKQMFAYRLSKYYNGSGDKATGTKTETVYQVAAVFNELVDDVPVIGPGGKIVVHMKHDGTVVEHEATTRQHARVVRTLSPDDLLTPDEAAAKAEESLKARGLTPADVTVERTEFGYLRHGRNAVQKYLAPHYAFFYRPLPGKGTKTIIEVVSAVKSADIAQLLDQDAGQEGTRRAVKRAFAGALDDDKK